MSTRSVAEKAKVASRALATVGSGVKRAALLALADLLEAREGEIRAANEKDLAAAKRDGLAEPLLKRLVFQGAKVEASAMGVRALAELPEPVGKVLTRTELDSGLVLTKVTCPLGLIGVIFESRPDALVQISALCLKSGNAVLLKGGREAMETNRVLAEIVREATREGLPEGWLQLLESRDEVSEMLGMDDLVDLVIPRGSNEFVRHIKETSRIPVMGHAAGICHVYVDKAAQVGMAVDIVEDSKCQYPSVCNAVETLLVHRDVAESFLPQLAKRLGKRKVELRGCERTREVISCKEATPEDWDSEYLDYILSIRVVDTMDAAMEHIHAHGSGHTECIVTEDAVAAERFMDAVDSADVFWNASTRFADGYRFGLGAEVGISTSKIHARGPVGLDGLMSTKWKLRGDGQTVAPYVEGQKSFTHRPLPNCSPRV